MDSDVVSVVAVSLLLRVGGHLLCQARLEKLKVLFDKQLIEKEVSWYFVVSCRIGLFL
jgi:hypothetical protein